MSRDTLDTSEIFWIVHSHLKLLTSLAGKRYQYLTTKNLHQTLLKRLEGLGVLKCINPEVALGRDGPRIRLRYILSETGFTILGHAIRNEREIELINLRNMIFNHYDLLKFIQAGKSRRHKSSATSTLRSFVQMGILTYSRGKGYKVTAKGASEIKLHEFTYRKKMGA